MTRQFTAAVLLLLALGPAVRADVKTREKSTFRIEGLLGGMVRIFGGSAARDGITATVALKGNRLATIGDQSGQIIDLTEQRVYTLDVRRKEYTVVTFAEMRAQFEKARAEAEKNMKEMKPEDRQQAEQAGKQLEIDVDVKETGEKKSMLGHNTRQVIVTLTAREKGKTLEDGGGFVMTSDTWLGPVLPERNEIGQFHLKYFKAVYGEAFAIDPQQTAALSAMFPSFATMSRRLQAEGQKLQGTALMTTTTFESVKSAEQMKAAEQQSGGGGGGIGGMIGRRIAGGRGQAQQRTKNLTMSNEVLSISTSVTDADVAIPVEFKQKK
jgi:hypothetical protein